jgi:hypothetical protein
VLDIFLDRVSRTICLGCLQTAILISASGVARITGVSLWQLGILFLLYKVFKPFKPFN